MKKASMEDNTQAIGSNVVANEKKTSGQNQGQNQN